MKNLYAKITAPLNSGIEGLKIALQTAIELEHATIPPYLYALYSISPGTNQRLSEIILSVVLQEMLHMALACNILNAIGGEPSLGRPDFIPNYPGPLPGAVGVIEVPLAPISKTVLHDVFMKIEQPETPLNFPVVQLLALEQPEPQTIGEFYTAIKKQLNYLSLDDNIFTGDPKRQLSTGLPGLKKITDLQSALASIELIIEQGEGTSATPLNALEKPAHYYLFASAYFGKELIPQKGDIPFAYAGSDIPFDENIVKKLKINPKPDDYHGTDAFDANFRFNKTYTKLLQNLHKTFNGSPLNILGSIGMMQQLKAEAMALTEIAIGNEQFAGPTFTYIQDT